MTRSTVVRSLLEMHGETFAQEAGITLRDKPGPLFQLLVLSMLCGAPIRASVAVRAARALFDAGLNSVEGVAGVTNARRVKILRDAGYARFVARAAKSLGASAICVREEYGGDLRRLRAEARGDANLVRKLLRALPGIGDTAVDVFFAEAQGIWPEVGPFAGARALEAAAALKLGGDAAALARISGEEMTVVVAALTRCALARDLDLIRA